MKITSLAACIRNSILFSCAIATFPTRPLWAQIVPDSTLPEPSIVESGCAVCTIDGGTLRDTNLFHSFREFSIPTGGEAFFNNGLAIENIFSRVTGDSISNIDGLIRANGTANLFLLNPNGILFGPNAQLDIGGSFLGSTADAIGFGDDRFYSASNPEAPPLLTVNPSALFFNRVSTGAIEVRSVAPAGMDVSENLLSGLRVPDGRSLVLAGGEISIEGNGLDIRGGLHALGGRVELAGVAGSGAIELSASENNLNLSVPEGLTAADISLRNGASVNTSGEGGGNIEVWGRRITIDGGSEIAANTLGTGSGGTVEIVASEAVQLTGSTVDGRFGSVVLVVTAGSGNAGDLRIAAKRLHLQDGAQIGVGSFGEGGGGNLEIVASESVQVVGRTPNGVAGSGLFSRSEAQGDAGNLTITTGELLIRDGAQVSAGTSRRSAGNGGSVTVNASESVRVIGRAPDGRVASFLAAQSGGVGNSGDLTITTQRLLVRDGGQVGTSTFGDGNGGSLIVNASESVRAIGTGFGTDNRIVSSGLFARSEGLGHAGNLTITTRELMVRDGAQVATGTSDRGAGGSLIVNADTVQLIGTSSDRQIFSGLFANTEPESSGNGGSIEVNSATIEIEDRATIAVDSQGTGIGGTIDLTADSLNLENEASIFAETASADGGNVQLRVGDLLFLSHESRISTNAGTVQAGGNGGDISISTPDGFIVARQNSDITANAFEGRGGNIDITAQSLFGIQPRNSLTDRSDITATSELNTDGQINIDTPDIDPTQGLANLPEAPGVPETARGCDTGDGTGRFVNSGRGGLPTVPMEPLDSNDILDDIQPPQGWENRESGGVDESDRLVEATGWMVDDDGRVVLVADDRTDRPDGCRG